MRRREFVYRTCAGLVALSRVYVGAHLPLDVVGGAALGVAVAAGVHLTLGGPPGRRASRRLSAPAAWPGDQPRTRP